MNYNIKCNEIYNNTIVLIPMKDECTSYELRDDRSNMFYELKKKVVHNFDKTTK